MTEKIKFFYVESFKDERILLGEVLPILEGKEFITYSGKSFDLKFLKTKCQLELSLASLCIILRKMCENQFITLNQERRKDINSIIHSNRFDFFEDYKVYVYSQKGQEEVNIIQLLDYAKKIFKEIV